MATIHMNGFIGVFDGALTQEECHFAIDQIETILTDMDASSKVQEETKVLEIPLWEWSAWAENDPEFCRAIAESLESYTSFHQGVFPQAEIGDSGFQGRKFLTGKGDLTPSFQMQHGSALLQCIICLNTVEEGGLTRYPQQGIDIRSVAGRVILAPASWTFPHLFSAPVNGPQYAIRTYLFSK